ncbi:MAG: hypothetical protein SFU98_05975, partial [Leptospiraceae bacterium]|nr:hypothetical protein [Leptospiraceae bacterium]
PSLFKKLNFYEKPFHSWLPVDSIIITLAEFKEFLEMKTDENLLYVYGNESLRDNSTSILSYLINKKGHSADKAEIQKFYKFPKDEFDKMIEKMIKAECIFERAGYIILTLKGFAVADYGVYHGVSNEISI